LIDARHWVPGSGHETGDFEAVVDPPGGIASVIGCVRWVGAVRSLTAAGLFVEIKLKGDAVSSRTEAAINAIGRSVFAFVTAKCLVSIFKKSEGKFHYSEPRIHS